jgi:hypothetical protein
VLATLPQVSLGRRLAGLCALLALVGSGLALASCGGDDGENASPTTETTTTVVTTTETTTETPPPPGPTEIRIVVVTGAARGGIGRETVERNDRVVLIVRADVSDHIHLHGYDIMRDVAPGRPARLPFRATIPGRFEVELEDRGVQIADITVQP